MRVPFLRRDLAPLTEARAHAATLLLEDGRVLVAGGGTRRANDRPTGDCEVQCRSTAAVDLLDVARGTTHALPRLRVPRESARLALTPRGVRVAGGHADHG